MFPFYKCSCDYHYAHTLSHGTLLLAHRQVSGHGARCSFISWFRAHEFCKCCCLRAGCDKLFKLFFLSFFLLFFFFFFLSRIFLTNIILIFCQLDIIFSVWRGWGRRIAAEYCLNIWQRFYVLCSQLKSSF